MLSHVQFYVSEMDKFCKISPRTWYITIFHCDGSVLEFANLQYLVVEAPNGHASVMLPPGEYSAIGVWGYWVGPNGNYFGNHFTHQAIFQVCCGANVCVKLYNPSVHYCGIIYDRAIQGFRQNIDVTEQILIDQNVPPTDARRIAIEEARVEIDTNLAGLQTIETAVKNFATAFGFEIQDGTGIKTPELINITANAEDMNELSKKNSEKIPQVTKLTAEFNIQN